MCSSDLTQLSHGALRAYVMDKRGADNENATGADIDHMARLTREAMEAGAFGFSSSRTPVHIALDGRPVPGTYAAEDELVALASASLSVARAQRAAIARALGG